MKRRRVTGFTLIEILVVIGIIVILTGIVLPVYFRLNQRQGEGTCIDNLREIGVALTQYREDYGAYPAPPAAEYLQSAATNATAPTALYMPVTSDASATTIVSGTPPPRVADLIISGMYTKDYPMLFTVLITQGDPTPMWQWTDSATVLANTAPVPQALTGGMSVPLGDTGITIIFASPTGYTAGQQWKFWETPTTGNFGLATLYYLYLKDTKDYVKSTVSYHCPLQTGTSRVDRGAVLAEFTDPNELSARYDPLWAGYNTYDVTYNYNQFAGVIQAYEGAVGQPSLQSPRQLQNAQPPHDTVVAWCYSHAPGGKPSYDVPALGNPVLPLTATPAQISSQQQGKQAQESVVLWLDGTADVVHPTLERGVDGYYWIPPFLATHN